MARSAFQVVFALIVIGLVLFFVSPYLPSQIMTMIFAVIAVGLLLWLANAAGLVGGGPTV